MESGGGDNFNPRCFYSVPCFKRRPGDWVFVAQIVARGQRPYGDVTTKANLFATLVAFITSCMVSTGLWPCAKMAFKRGNGSLKMLL